MSSPSKPSDQTYTTNSTTPFHLADESPGMAIEDDTLSAFSFSSTTDGIDVLGGAEDSMTSNFRQFAHLRAARIVSAVWYKRTILSLILVTLILLGVRTLDLEDGPAKGLEWVLDGFLFLFTMEVLVSVAFYQEQIVKAGWLAADMGIVLIAWWIDDVSVLALRGFRLIRALRKASGVRELKWAVKAVLRVLPRLAAVLGILLPGMLAIFAVLMTNLYQDAAFEFNMNGSSLSEDYFSRLDISVLTLFQIMTGGRNWAVLCAELQEQYPSAWLPVSLFVVVAMFFFGSLIVAVMCDAVATVNQERAVGAAIPTAALKTQSDPYLCGQEEKSLRELERKVDDLTASVDSLLRMQTNLQESINSLGQRDMARQMMASSEANQASKSSLAASAPPKLNISQSDDTIE